MNPLCSKARGNHPHPVEPHRKRLSMDRCSYCQKASTTKEVFTGQNRIFLRSLIQHGENFGPAFTVCPGYDRMPDLVEFAFWVAVEVRLSAHCVLESGEDCDLVPRHCFTYITDSAADRKRSSMPCHLVRTRRCGCDWPSKAQLLSGFVAASEVPKISHSSTWRIFCSGIHVPITLTVV